VCMSPNAEKGKFQKEGKQANGRRLSEGQLQTWKEQLAEKREAGFRNSWPQEVKWQYAHGSYCSASVPVSMSYTSLKERLILYVQCVEDYFMAACRLSNTCSLSVTILYDVLSPDRGLPRAQSWPRQCLVHSHFRPQSWKLRPIVP
jgi:hypothetical protein